MSGPQVVLKFRRRKFNQQQHHAGEISVTRRLFRSGDSEYLLNGKLCRLRDIQELFMGTGLGPESYALIEQGRIGQILSSRPTDRRNIIEEAAGITKFKTKKRLAEARLEDAKTNLNRVNDIFEEVTRQMNSLKRQASKAERYARLRDEMRAKLRVVLASKFTQMEQESVTLDAQIHELGEEIRQQSESVQQSESEHSERTQRGYAIETATRHNRVSALRALGVVFFRFVHALGLLADFLAQLIDLGIERHAFLAHLGELAGEHNPQLGAHLVAQPGIALGLAGLALERVHLARDLFENVVHAIQIGLGVFESRLSQTLLRLEFRNASRFFNDVAAVGRTAAQNLADASLLDERV